MAKDSDPLAGAFETKETGGILSGLLADENEFDRRTMWRLGSWGAAAVGAIVVAVMANQAQLGWRRDQVASADFARQAERLALLARESQNEARRLTAAIETLNTDRDRLYTRVTVLEQGLDSVTGAIAKQNAAPAQPAVAKPEPSATAPAAPAPQAAAPAVAPVASTPATANDKPAKETANKDAATKDASHKEASNKDAPNKDVAKEHASPPQQTAAAAPSASTSAPATSELPAIPLVAAKSMMAPPDPAATKLMQPEKAAKPKDQAPATEIAAAPPNAEPEAASDGEAAAITVQQTRFAVDLGSASSVPGLRALWRGLTKANPDLAKLRPIIMVKESKIGPGMQLRLGAGPLVNAAAAAKICAALSENDRACETAVFDGQRLSMQGQEKAQDVAPQAETPAPAAKPEKPHRRSYSSSKRSKREEPAPPPAAAPAKPETSSTLSSFFSRR